MPPTIIDRLPLPSLQAYTTISVLFLSISIYYALQVTSDPEWILNVFDNVNASGEENQTEPVQTIKVLLHNLLRNDFISRRLYDIAYFVIVDTLCLWSVINATCCTMILFGKCIQKLVFGELRGVEQQHMKDKFWNFVFYKFIFIFGVMNVQYIEEVVLWCGWFAFVGFFHLLSTLCKDRFEYLSFSPTTPKWTHLRLFALIFFILGVSVSVFIVVGLYANLSTFCFMSAEWALVVLRTLYILARYILHLYDISYEGIWENRGVYAYYSELTFELSSNTVDFLHHLHMLFWGNILLSMATLVICMQLRCLFYEIQHKLIRHKNYLRVTKHMETHYPLATKEEIEANSDDCAICWDRMESARKLPCGHMFHTSCLHSWLEQVINCPTCRTPLIQSSANTVGSDENRNNILGQDDMQGRPTNQTTNHFFHFDGSRYVSWFPSFSVEVSHTSLLGERQQLQMAAHTSQLDTMVHTVQQMFPHMPYNVIFEDLLMTRSVELTVENILEERLVSPTVAVFPNTSHMLSPVNSPHPLHAYLSGTPSTGFPSSSSMEQRASASNFRGSETSEEVPEQPSQLVDENIIRSGGDGCRFSKSSQERERMLSQRKEDLIRKAKMKYISRSVMPDQPSTSK